MYLQAEDGYFYQNPNIIGKDNDWFLNYDEIIKPRIIIKEGKFNKVSDELKNFIKIERLTNNNLNKLNNNNQIKSTRKRAKEDYVYMPFPPDWTGLKKALVYNVQLIDLIPLNYLYDQDNDNKDNINKENDNNTKINLNNRNTPKLSQEALESNIVNIGSDQISCFKWEFTKSELVNIVETLNSFQENEKYYAKYPIFDGMSPLMIRRRIINQLNLGGIKGVYRKLKEYIPETGELVKYTIVRNQERHTTSHK